MKRMIRLMTSCFVFVLLCSSAEAGGLFQKKLELAPITGTSLEMKGKVMPRFFLDGRKLKQREWKRVLLSHPESAKYYRRAQAYQSIFGIVGAVGLIHSAVNSHKADQWGVSESQKVRYRNREQFGFLISLLSYITGYGLARPLISRAAKAWKPTVSFNVSSTTQPNAPVRGPRGTVSLAGRF